MTSGVLAAPARAVAAPATGGTAAPTMSRHLLLVLALAALTTLSGLAPGSTGRALPVVANFVAIIGACVVLVRAAPATAHPSAWRWYAGAVALGGGGAALAGVLVPWGQTALGSIPGQLLVVVSIAQLLDRAKVWAARSRLATSLVLFVIADLLTVHTLYHLTIADRGLLSLSETITFFALLFTIALGTGAALVLMSVSGPAERRVAVLVFAAQCVASTAGGFSVLTTGPHLLQHLACGASVLGLGLVSVACRVDRPVACTPREAAASSAATFGSLLPHATAMVGGSLLLMSVPLTGRITIFGTTLGVLGLIVLFVHQTVSWRTQLRLTDDLQRGEAWFRTLVRSNADPVLILDEQLRVQWVSPAITGLLGMTPHDIVGDLVTASVHPDDVDGLIATLTAQRTDPSENRTATARVQHRDGRWRLIQAQVRDLRDDPDVGALVLYCRDVSRTAPEPAAADLTTFSATDPATGLPNRSALTQRLAATLRLPSVRSTSLVVLGVDGLTDGDDVAVLQELTTRFARALRGDDWLARAGVSEFAVLVDGTVADAEVVAGRLVAAVEPVGTLRLTAAAGVAPLSADTQPGDALRRGDLALRSARAAGPGRVRRHSDALRISQDREEQLRADLGCALDRGQLRLAYQPVVDLALHRTVSVEALLRWRHPVYGEVSPGEFVPLAEESALIIELGRWVLHEATRTVVALDQPDLGVAVNVSARHVRSGELVADVLAALHSSGLPASRLVLEITESVLLDDDHVTDDLAALRRLGVRIAVDDFGTGWSSLAYLVGLPIDVLKMDRQFLAHVETDPQRRALCASVLHLGTSLGLAVIVEGVETPAELQLLRDMGHRFIQGFLLARPLDADALPGQLPGITATPAGIPRPRSGDGDA